MAAVGQGLHFPVKQIQPTVQNIEHKVSTWTPSRVEQVHSQILSRHASGDSYNPALLSVIEKLYPHLKGPDSNVKPTMNNAGIRFSNAVSTALASHPNKLGPKTGETDNPYNMDSENVKNLDPNVQKLIPTFENFRTDVLLQKLNTITDKNTRDAIETILDTRESQRRSQTVNFDYKTLLMANQEVPVPTGMGARLFETTTINKWNNRFDPNRPTNEQAVQLIFFKNFYRQNNMKDLITTRNALVKQRNTGEEYSPTQLKILEDLIHMKSQKT